jgi:anti-anti-sigma factor
MRSGRRVDHLPCQSRVAHLGFKKSTSGKKRALPGKRRFSNPEEGSMIERKICADGQIWLRAFGDFDWTAAVALRHAIEDSIYPGARLVIDLGNVENIDAVGLSAVGGWVRRAQSMGGGIQIVNAPSRVRAALRVPATQDLADRPTPGPPPAAAVLEG